MTRNEKLAHVLAGRTITSAVLDDSGRAVALDDGATMYVATSSAPLTFNPSSDAVPRSPIVSVWQQGATLRLGTDNGTTIDFPLREEGAGVIVRDATGKVVYAG